MDPIIWTLSIGSGLFVTSLTYFAMVANDRRIKRARILRRLKDEIYQAAKTY